MNEQLKWRNCFAEVISSNYGRIALSFLNEVIEPALKALQLQRDNCINSGDEWAVFYISDLEELIKTTSMAFCLSIQSLWERQIREYLIRCAHELSPNMGLEDKIATGKWTVVEEEFYSLRGISINKFVAYKDLRILNKLGDACRHGEGRAASWLRKNHPEFWPENNMRAGIPHRPINDIDIRIGFLKRFIKAIIYFWNEVEIIYLESIPNKNSLIVEELEKKRYAIKGNQDKDNSC